MTLHIKELWCSVGDGAPLSGPILKEKVYKHDSCNVLMRWSFVISAAERFSDLTWTVMASRDPRTSILALFMEPKSINKGRSFSSSKTLVGFKSLFSEIKQHIKYCIYCTIQSLGLVRFLMFLNEVSYAHKDAFIWSKMYYIYLIQ